METFDWLSFRKRVLFVHGPTNGKVIVQRRYNDKRERTPARWFFLWLLVQ